ncbi:MAG: outer membrane beta-barrel protein [Verrucomicrobiota bacterium]
MKINKCTIGLIAVGLVSLASVAQAEEKSVPLMTALSQTIISGYVDTSAVWNPGTGNANPAPVSFNYGKQDGFNLNVVNLTLEKPLDEGQWSAGYKAELLFGPDAVGFNNSANARTAVNGTSSGIVNGTATDALTTNSFPVTGSSEGTSSGSGATLSDFGIKQAYVALRAPVGNGLDFKLGVFDSPIGYESFVGYRNPNYTRSYGYTLEPTEHTGVLASYQVNDVFAFSAGVANTLNAGINARSTRSESSKAYMASLTITAPESAGVLAGSAFYAGIVDGFGSAEENQTTVYLGATIATPVAGLKLGAAYDQAYHLGGLVSHGYADSIGLYASFQATEKLSIHARGEYAKVDPLFGTHARVLGLTGTVQYDLWANVISRFEVRWDHSTSGNELFGGTTFRDYSKKNEIMLAANLIYKF